MASYRANTHVLELDTEADFATINADFTAESLEMPVFGVSWTAERQALENPANRQDLGEHAPSVGFSFESNECKVSTQMQGLGTIGAPVLQAAATAQCQALGGVFGVDAQAAARRSTGSTVKAASTPTETEVVETDAGNHAVNQFMPLLGADGKYRSRPVLTYATDTATFAVGVPTAQIPAVGSILPGVANLEWYDDDVTAALASIQCEMVGQDSSDNVRFLGMVGNLSIPEKGPNEAPQFDLTYRAANFADLFARTQAPSVNPLPYTAAGGEFYLAAYGSAVPIYLDQIRLGIEFGATYDPLEDHNDEVDGIEGWMRADIKRRITITIPQETACPASLTSAATTFRASWRARSTGVLDRFHFGCSWGLGQIGRGVSMYFSDLVMIEMPDAFVTINGRRAQKFVLAPVANSPSSMPSVMYGAW